MQVGDRVHRSKHMLKHLLNTDTVEDYLKAINEVGTITFIGLGVTVVWDSGIISYGPYHIVTTEVYHA